MNAVSAALLLVAVILFVIAALGTATLGGEVGTIAAGLASTAAALLLDHGYIRTRYAR